MSADIKGKGFSYWLGVISGLLLITSPLMVIYNQNLSWSDVAWAMFIWAVVAFVCGAVNLTIK